MKQRWITGLLIYCLAGVCYYGMAQFWGSTFFNQLIQTPQQEELVFNQDSARKWEKRPFKIIPETPAKRNKVIILRELRSKTPTMAKCRNQVLIQESKEVLIEIRQ